MIPSPVITAITMLKSNVGKLKRPLQSHQKDPATATTGDETRNRSVGQFRRCGSVISLLALGLPGYAAQGLPHFADNSLLRLLGEAPFE